VRGGGVFRVIENALFACLFIPLARHAPALSRRMQPIFAWCSWRLHAGRRRSLRRTARILLGPGAAPRDLDRFGRRVMTNIQSFIADVATIDRRSVESLAAGIDRYEGLDVFLEVLRRGKGMILASAHLGSFESAVAALRRVSDVPVQVAFARDRLAAFDRVRSRARRHLRIIESPVDDGVQSWLAMRDALEHGAVVAILADRVMPGQQGATLRFLGQPSRLPTGPVRLAALSGAPLVPTFVIPGRDGRSTLRFEPPIEVTSDARAIDDDHPGQRSLIDAMERAIRAAPEHWLVVEGPWMNAR